MALPGSLSEIIEDFRRRGVDTARPGFYDSSAFAAAEAEDSRYLATYARFVDELRQGASEVGRARDVVEIVASKLAGILRQDGSLGVCVNVSLALSRMLEEQGVWNYVARGTALVQVRSGSHVLETGFHSVDGTDNPIAHTWVVAPPYRVVDITLAFQGYASEVQSGLWSPILAEELVPPTPRAATCFTEQAAGVAIRRHGSVENAVDREYPDLKYFLRWFPGGALVRKGTALLYQATGIAASQEGLDEMTGTRLGGRLFAQHYAEAIQPALTAAGVSIT